MASEILTHFKQRIRQLTLEPSSGGCFELTADDRLVFSKLQTGRFPEEGEVMNALKQLVV